MGLPYSLQLGDRVDELNRELECVVGNISALAKEDLSTRREQLKSLCALAGSGLRLRASSQHRLAASSAYSRIVSDRVAFLKMEPVRGLPSMADYLQTALRPAARTTAAVERRLAAVADASQLTSELMRTMLSVEHQAHANAELEQLRGTAKTQLLLTQMGEGLSVVAITYYALGVLGHVVKAAHEMHALPLAPELYTGLCVPFVGAGVYLGLHALKNVAMRSS